MKVQNKNLEYQLWLMLTEPGTDGKSNGHLSSIKFNLETDTMTVDQSAINAIYDSMLPRYRKTIDAFTQLLQSVSTWETNQPEPPIA